MDDLERLGESVEFGWVLLELLEKAGWFIYVTTPLAGGMWKEGKRRTDVMIVGAHRALDFDIKASGPSVADAATPFFLECMKYRTEIRAAA